MVALPFSQTLNSVPNLPYGKLPKNLVTIGDHLRKARLERKLFQKDLALYMGVSEDGYRFWETNQAIPQIQYMPKIISFLGYNPDSDVTESMTGKLKAYRVTHGLSQKKLGNLLGVNPSTISAWESGESNPSPKTMETLTKLLNDS